MAALEWDVSGSRYYETGIDKAVLYVKSGSSYGTGVAWNGIISVSESPDGAESTDMYADNIKYASMRSAEKFGASIEAYTYPDAFGACDGSASPVTGAYLSQQARSSFGLCYRTKVGNDTSSDPNAYKIHIIYNASVTPSEKSYETINDSPSAITFSWTVETTPETVTGYKPCAHVVIDSRYADATKLATVEAKLYGSGTTPGTNDPQLPSISQLISDLAAG